MRVARMMLFPVTVTLAVIILIFLITGEGVAGRASVRATICDVFGPRCGPALRVAQCESRFQPWAWSGADAGVFQANYPTWRRSGDTVATFRARHANVLYHVRWAYRLSERGTNWWHWRFSQRCWG